MIVGGNPAYNAPVDLKWVAAQRKAANVVRISYYEDETAEATDWHFPLAHYLESWGDARTADGVYLPVQPLIQPLFGGITVIEFLARLAGLSTFDPYQLVRDTFGSVAGGPFVENAWKKFLHDGFLADSGHRAVEASLNWSDMASSVGQAKAQSAPTDKSLEVVFARDARVESANSCIA